MADQTPSEPAVTDDPRGKKAHRYRAFAVHVFTASGATIAFLALTAAIDKQMGLAFAWLGLALVVDGIDGTFDVNLIGRVGDRCHYRHN